MTFFEMKLFTETLLNDLTAQAAASPRRRAHHTIHASAADPIQRFFVVANEGTYFRPHMHLTKSELAIAVRGRFDIVTFDEHGHVLDRFAFGTGTENFAYEMAPGTWHTLVTLTDGSAFLEVKQGPYDPAVAVDFAPWAPSEGSDAVPRLLSWLRTAEVGTIFTG
jgi:cupin fold WbuC family metalloprotein